MPRVSIVIPTFNRAALLPHAVASALAAGDDVEVIVVDDASEDETQRVCASLPGIRYLRLDRNMGTPNARNVGVLESRAEFLTTLGDDDLRLPGTLEAQVRLLEESSDAAFCYGRIMVADARHESSSSDVVPLQTPTGDIFWDLLEHNFVPDLSVVARKARLVEAGLFNPRLVGVEDWDMWLRLSARWPVMAVAEPVAVYRKANSASGQICSDSIKIYRRMLRLQKKVLGQPRSQGSTEKCRRARASLRDNAYEAMIYEAEQALAEGESKLARARISEAFRLRPLRATLGSLALLRRCFSAELLSS